MIEGEKKVEKDERMQLLQNLKFDGLNFRSVLQSIHQINTYLLGHSGWFEEGIIELKNLLNLCFNICYSCISHAFQSALKDNKNKTITFIFKEQSLFWKFEIYDFLD